MNIVMTIAFTRFRLFLAWVLNWAFVISKVFLGWPSPFVKLYKAQHIFCHQTSYWSRAITGDSDGLFWTEHKAGSMKILFLFFIISSGNSRYLLCDHAVTDRIGDPDFTNRFSRFVDWVHRSCNHFDLFGFELLM